MKKFKTYTVSDFFEIVSGTQPPINNRYKIKKDEMVNTITGATTNNGISFYSHSKKSFNNELTISKDGEYAGTVFLQTQPFILGGHVLGVFEKNKMSNTSKLYISTLINKQIGIWSGADRPSVQISRLKSMQLVLPSLENGSPDWNYMADYVRRIEADYVRRIEAYLKVLGYPDLESVRLIETDREILRKYSKSKFSEFTIETILDWQPQKEINPLKLNSLFKEGNLYPFYGQSTINKGIISYESLKSEVLNNREGKPTILIHSNNQNVVYLDTPFYLKDGHGATSVLQSTNLNKFTGMFLVGAIKKAILGKFSYNNKATKIALKNTSINIPINDNGLADFDLMENYIKVIQKITVSKLREDLDRRLKAYNQVI